jgi:hypothetical protein
MLLQEIISLFVFISEINAIPNPEFVIIHRAGPRSKKFKQNRNKEKHRRNIEIGKTRDSQ